MQLTLEGISKKVAAESWLYEMSLAPHPGAVTVLLGATQAGKTSLMRIMAGLDQPSLGRVRVGGVDVTGQPVRKRNVAMVYQQFINYPSLTVAENIASPLKLRREHASNHGSTSSLPNCTSNPCCNACPRSSRVASNSVWHWRARWPRTHR